MAWVTPPTRANGDVVTAGIWNADIKDNSIYLKGLSTHVSGGYVTRSGANLLYAPDQSNRVRCYEGTEWVEKTIPDAGITVAATALTADTDYYLYVYDNSGTLTLDLSTTAPTTQNGISVKNGSTSRTTIARCRANASGAITTYVEDASTQLVCNELNARPIALYKQDTTASWTYQGNWREVRGQTSVNCVAFVSNGKRGVAAIHHGSGRHASQTAAISIGLDSSSAVATGATISTQIGASTTRSHSAQYTGVPAAGFHRLYAIEGTNDSTTGAATFEGQIAGGSGGVAVIYQQGLVAKVWA